MPALDTSSWNIPGKSRPSTIIDGEARDVTRNQSDETVDLSSEPEFPSDLARDRSGTLNAASAPSQLRNWMSKLPYGPLRALDPKRLNTKAQLFEQLTRTLPLNEFNLPNYIYRPDMLDAWEIRDALISIRTDTSSLNAVPSGEPDLFGAESSPTTGGITTTPLILSSAQKADPGIDRIQSQLEAAMVSLDYSEGFPALANGNPFWRQLDTEGAEAFNAFIAYLELGGARKRKDLMISYPPDFIEECFHVNFWQYRAKAFELYRVADANKIRLQRMLATEDSHYKVAEKMFAKLSAAMEKFTDTDYKDLGIEKAVGVMDKVVKIQRISVGLNANGGAIDPQDLKKSPTTVVIAQQIVRNTGESAQIDEDAPDLLVDSPDAIEAAQDLIIRVQQGQDLE